MANKISNIHYRQFNSCFFHWPSFDRPDPSQFDKFWDISLTFYSHKSHSHPRIHLAWVNLLRNCISPAFHLSVCWFYGLFDSFKILCLYRYCLRGWLISYGLVLIFENLLQFLYIASRVDAFAVLRLSSPISFVLFLGFLEQLLISYHL